MWREGVWRCKVQYIHVLMRDERRKAESSKQFFNKAKQHNAPKAVTFLKKNELPRVGLELLYKYMYTVHVCESCHALVVTCHALVVIHVRYAWLWNSESCRVP